MAFLNIIKKKKNKNLREEVKIKKKKKKIIHSVPTHIYLFYVVQNCSFAFATVVVTFD